MNSRCLIFLWLSTIAVSQVSPFSFGRRGRPEKRIENDDLKQIFLEKLGLSKEPNVTRAKTTRKEMKDMIAVYERSLTDDDHTTAEEPSGQRLNTFRDNAPKTGKKDIHLLSFPVGSAARGLMLHSAKLHIYKKLKITNDNSANIELYQLMESSMLDSPQSLLIESRRVTFDDSGWEVFDVTNAVATWLERPSTNHGFSVKCKDCSRRKLVIVTADSVKESSNRALLDVSIVNSFKGVGKRSYPLIPESEEEDVLNDCTEGDDENNLCCRYSMWVSFKDVGWDWIVKPEGYHAYYCKGECPYRYLNYANTHALFQSIYNSKYDKTIPPPCCVPKSLKRLELLHYTDSDPPLLMISRQAGMIAESCGCS